jgi:peptidoglycan-N-acetylglucosamine deacetylase
VSHSSLTSRQLSDASLRACVTISVDDGSASDLKTADLLDKYGLQATFYIPAHNPERQVLASSEIRILSDRFEIGSHTLNHTPLKSISDGYALREILDGKSWLENTVGATAISFCYPRGKFNRSTPTLVKTAGFLGARTQLLNIHEFPKNPFLWGVSTHAWSHSKAIQVRHALLEWNFVGILNFFREYKAITDWELHFTRALGRVAKHGGLAHLALHSWEIEELGEWKKLESMFDLISRSGLPTATNGELYRAWHRLHETNDEMVAAPDSA